MIINDQASSKLKAEHSKRCFQLCGILAFIILVLTVVMLILAITSQYSEQKTIFYVVFVSSTIGFFILLGTTVHQYLNKNAKEEKISNFKANQLQLSRFLFMSQHFDNQMVCNDNQII